MLKPVRREAGLGNPPLPFTTNASESFNAILNRKADYKKNELHVFINHLKQVVDEQEKEVERAVIGRGKYKFHPDYTHLKIKESGWFKVTRSERKAHKEGCIDSSLNWKWQVTPCELTWSSNWECFPALSTEHFHSGLKIPLASAQGIWQKAEELLCEPNAISAAPGCDSKSRMVRSCSGKWPHLVMSTKQGRYTCDNDCPNWKSMKLCSHTVAVAELNGSLWEFCELYWKAKHVPSMSQLAGLRSGVGNKGNQVNWKRKREPENERIPLSRGHTPDNSGNQPQPNANGSHMQHGPATIGNQPGDKATETHTQPGTLTLENQPEPSTCISSPQSYCFPYQGPYSSFNSSILSLEYTLWRYQCIPNSTTPTHSFSIPLHTMYASFQFGISFVV